ncbi:hypothetical protein [Natronolimnohabitans innermongolicus]|uniref:Uncharacterized protein n=1 Tax=Natronolimnohabitans innermongolicus JCM 12255 TaxID=1227499 RepID=L9WUN0_9EURY|nr:hypothetical protein [Natronolimnohabitans innermongolicus]ELY52023.1 hypothetical protein C493_16721 [Natronolimnohabitans innermongolicus JCM 12255]
MTARDTVTELIAEGTLRVDVPVDRGDELAIGAQDVLESLPVVRYADVREIVDVDAGEGGLSVAVDCRLTLHLEGTAADVAAVRDSLLELDRVLGIDRLEAVDGPYRIERW